MNTRTGSWDDELWDVIEAMTRALYMGKHILAHCQHGLHRTGSLITLWLALGLVAQEGVRDRAGWLDKLAEAWRTWSLGRQLRQATMEDRRRRDYEGESWRAVLSFFPRHADGCRAGHG